MDFVGGRTSGAFGFALIRAAIGPAALFGIRCLTNWPAISPRDFGLAIFSLCLTTFYLIRNNKQRTVSMTLAEGFAFAIILIAIDVLWYSNWITALTAAVLVAYAIVDVLLPWLRFRKNPANSKHESLTTP